MPEALKKRCGFRGCPRTTRERYCEEHAPLARRFYDRQRGSSTERGYDGAWERVAECRRHMDCGLCQPCLAEGFVTASAIVDHIIPIHVRPDWRLEIGNTQVICHPCHTRKTSEDTRRYGGRARTNPSREQMENRYCWAGLDLPSTQDITALVLVFRDEDQYTALPFFWVPEEGARQRAHRDRVPYQDWIREGYIEATPGSVIDYDRIRAKINELGKQYDILEIAIDRWNATQLATQLTDDGFEMVAFGQG